MRRLVNDPHGSSREIARRLARRIERFAGSATGLAASRQPTAEPTRDDNMSLELYSLRSKLRLSDGQASSLIAKSASSAQPATQIAPATQEISMLHDEAVLQVYSARAAECRLLATIERERERLETIELNVEECQKALVQPEIQIVPATQEISMLHDEAVLRVYSARAAECRLLAAIERERERLESIESYVEECQKALVLGMQAMEQGMQSTQT
jgi:cyanophycinase-like exopeptidase